MACRIYDDDSNIERENSYKREALAKVATIYETIYPEDDMPFETLRNLCQLHIFTAEYDAQADNEISAKEHLLRALDCAEKSLDIKDHCLTTPMIDKWHVDPSPDNNRQISHILRRKMADAAFDSYRDKEWFIEILEKIEGQK